MKRTKNQGCGIVVKAQYSDFLKIFASMRFILIAPEILILSMIFCEAADKISISVHAQNPIIPRPEVILN
jgi:hypothetical protein